MNGITAILLIVSIVLIGLIIGCIVLLVKTNKAIKQAQLNYSTLNQDQFNNLQTKINTNYQPYSTPTQSYEMNSNVVNDFNQQPVYNQVPTNVVSNSQSTYQPPINNFNQTTMGNMANNTQSVQPNVYTSSNSQTNPYNPNNYPPNDSNNQNFGA